MTFAVVTGGGTSGHVIPAISICEALIDAGHDATELKYVGALFVLIVILLVKPQGILGRRERIG